ncbi:TerC family protein [Agrococcus carbonis]|uniref:Membrane protein TerC, possibly involved in tellurium resistance n=1 Tax=Agrococcus carbonis TaxID=684552 RepID=A0A1H1Q8J5_9MICO|nr:TerC family protein [Agrococcus carbonis]SDS19821.1 Membrane protein TerC, possibly involved in tellurium resistance [Agrococcus carbonis]
MDFSLEFTPDLIAIFLTLFVLEIVLGVDNVIFISILASKLPESQQAKARTLGLTLAMVMRVGLVLLAGWIITLNDELFSIFGMGFSGRELILIAGGGFLLYKAVHEIHLKLEGEEEHASSAVKATFGAVLVQILLMDLVFSLDSVITAVGMTSNMIVIIAAVVISFGILLFAARYIFDFVNRHPTVKMLALSFLLLIGVFLVAEGFGFHIDKAFIYGPMVFAVLVESLNLWASARKRKRAGAHAEPVRLHDTMTPESALAGAATGQPSAVDEGAAPGAGGPAEPRQGA